MNITLQLFNDHKYSVLLQQDFKLADFLEKVNKAGICVNDYIFIARGNQLKLDDEVVFDSQKHLFVNTYIQVSPKQMYGSNVLSINKKS